VTVPAHGAAFAAMVDVPAAPVAAGTRDDGNAPAFFRPGGDAQGGGTRPERALCQAVTLQPAEHAPELRLPYAAAKQNFYEAARLGLAAHVNWYDRERWGVARLVQRVLLDQARKGLEVLRVDRDDIDRYLAVIEARVAGGATGAAWQRGFLDRYGRDLRALTCVYRDLSAAGEPVHTWDV